MEYEISSGNGSAECELAVTKFASYLVKEYGATIVSTSAGYHRGTDRTAMISCETDLLEFVGSVLWICKSPYRPSHKRKNWFINFQPSNTSALTAFDPDKVVFTTCHSRGNGGQRK